MIFRYSSNGKKYKATLPEKVRFIRVSDYMKLIEPTEFEVVGVKKPQKGEYYLSGADIAAYLAFNNMNIECIVVKKKINNEL